MSGTETANHTEQRRGAAEIVLASLLGLVEGDILLHLDAHGATPVRRLMEELNWPGSMVTMGVGALVREGLVRVRPDEFEAVVEPRRPGVGREPVPDAWRD